MVSDDNGKRGRKTSNGDHDLTIDILRSIRDEIVGMRADTNDRLERLEVRLEHLEVHTGRVEQGVLDLGRFMKQIARDQAKHERFHLQHVSLLEKDVEDLKERVRKLEENRAQ
ncbi:MAG: hypothetical protein V2A73_17285 [Pseudomonadota bacterium]